MASHVLTPGTFPAGTTVYARLRSNWPAVEQDSPSGTPGAATANGTVAADSTLTITGLAAATRYWLHGEVGGAQRYVAVYVEPPSTGKQDAATAATDTELAAHEADTTDVHGIPDAAVLVTDAELAAHAADATAVHGIADTGALVVDGDAAGGVLSGTYPSPGFAADMATQAELDAINAALDTRLDSVESGGEAWREVGAGGEPAFQNSWVNFGGAYTTAGFYKDSFGIVRLKGFVKDGTVSGVIFTLPAGYRPAAHRYFVGITEGGTGPLVIQSGGDVYLLGGNNTWLTLDATFRVA